MTSDRAVVAVLLREAEWVVADAAHRIPQGTFGTKDYRDLADVLERLTAALHRRLDHGGTPPPTAGPQIGH
jgi:hypothetical protein